MKHNYSLGSFQFANNLSNLTFFHQMPYPQLSRSVDETNYKAKLFAQISRLILLTKHFGKRHVPKYFTKST